MLTPAQSTPAKKENWPGVPGPNGACSVLRGASHPGLSLPVRVASGSVTSFADKEEGAGAVPKSIRCLISGMKKERATCQLAANSSLFTSLTFIALWGFCRECLDEALRQGLPRWRRPRRPGRRSRLSGGPSGPRTLWAVWPRGRPRPPRESSRRGGCLAGVPHGGEERNLATISVTYGWSKTGGKFAQKCG